MKTGSNLPRSLKSLLGIVVLLAAAGCGGAAATGQPGVMEGQTAPDFTLQTPDGQSLSLASLRGQVVLINFWASWCDPCKLEMPDIQKEYAAHKDAGLAVLAVNASESAAVVKQFAAEYGLTFPIVLDARGQVAAQYRTSGLPMSLVVDREGVIRVRHLGYMSNGELIKYLSRMGLE